MQLIWVVFVGYDWVLFFNFNICNSYIYLLLMFKTIKLTRRASRLWYPPLLAIFMTLGVPWGSAGRLQLVSVSTSPFSCCGWFLDGFVGTASLLSVLAWTICPTVSIIRYFAGYASASKWSEHKTEYLEGPFQFFRDVLTKFVHWRKISGRSKGKLWRLTSPFLYVLLHPQATHLLPPLDWVVGVSSAIVQGTIVGKQSVQIRGKVTKYQKIVTFQCTHTLKSIIGRFHREILVRSWEKSHCFLLTKMAALTPWRHGSSRAKTAWFKSRSGVNSGFRRISRKVMVRSQ